MYKRVGNKWKMLRNVCPLRNKPCLHFFRSRRFRREMGIVKSGVVGECRMCFFVSQNTAALCFLPFFFFPFSRRPKREEGALFLSLLIAACPTIAIPRLVVRSATIAVIRRIAIV